MRVRLAILATKICMDYCFSPKQLVMALFVECYSRMPVACGNLPIFHMRFGFVRTSAEVPAPIWSRSSR